MMVLLPLISKEPGKGGPWEILLKKVSLHSHTKTKTTKREKSASLCRKLGYSLQATVDCRVLSHQVPCLFVLFYFRVIELFQILLMDGNME